MSRDPPPAAQSTSNHAACAASGPWVSTSHHAGLAWGVATPTWFGTMSTSTPMPASCAARATMSSPSAPPRAASSRVGSTTSYPWSEPGSASSSGER